MSQENSRIPHERFMVYLQVPGSSSFKPARRITVVNFRKNSKSLGACAFNLIRKTALTDNESLPKANQRFVIVDTYGLKNYPEQIDSFTEAPCIFFGRIRNITLNKFKDTDDYIGEISGDEDGWYMQSQPILACLDIPFNAFVDNVYLANMKKREEGSEVAFEKYIPKKLKYNEVSELEWPVSDQENVWSLQDAILYVGQVAGIEFKMPWDVDNVRITQNNNNITVPPGETLENQNGYISGTQNKKDYVVFFDKTKAKSYPSIYGKSVVEWLDEVLLDVFTYRFYYTSSGSINCDIINKSLVKTDLFPRTVLQHDLSINSRNTNVAITEVGETYTQVEVVSNRCLFAGTLTSKNFATGQKTLDRNWEWQDEKNYAYGADNDVISNSPSIYRGSKAAQKAYSNFKFMKDVNSDCPIMVSPPMNFVDEYTERTRIPFFPSVGVKESDGSLIISETLGSHQTPDTSNMRWASNLPFGYNSATSKYSLFEPFVSLTVTTEKSPNKKSILHLHGNTEKPKLDLGDDVEIYLSQPQTLGYIEQDAKLFEINGTNNPPSTSSVSGEGGSYDWGLGASDTSPNPSTASLRSFPNLSHWSMIYLTIAGYSAQRISLYAVNSNSKISTKRKVIFAEDCEYWIAHPGTFKPTVQISTDAGLQGYDYVPELVSTSPKHKILRNDYKKQKSYLDMYSAFLFLEKKSVSLDYTLDGWINNFEIGMPIQSIKDGKETIVANSSVESIEYFIEQGNPRIRISTLIPELPPLKKLADQIHINSSAPSISPLTKYKEPLLSIQKQENKNAVTTIQGQGGSGGGGAPVYGVWQLIGGSNIIPSGIIGVRKVVYTGLIENLELDEVVNLLVPGTLQKGVGVAINLMTQDRALIYTGTSPMNVDIWLNSFFIGYGTISVKITGTGTDPVTNPLRTQNFLIPLCLG